MEVVEDETFITFFYPKKPAKKIHKKLYKKHLTLLRKVRSGKELEKLCNSLEISVARSYAYSLLAQRSYLSTELAAKLASKEVEQQVIQEVIAECCRLGYLDDQTLYQRLIEAKIEAGWGKRKIAELLARKGGGVAATRLLDLFFPLAREKEALQRFAAKQWPTTRPKERASKAKMFRTLNRKGFHPELIREFLFDDY